MCNQLPIIALSSAYLPPALYFALLMRYPQHVVIEACEHFEKQSYRNRMHIATANGLLPLSIPLERSIDPDKKMLTSEMHIAPHGNWQHFHWNAIQSAYSSTPFFEYYADDFLPFYTRDFDSLWDFNKDMTTLLLNLLGIKEVPCYTTVYEPHYAIDLRSKIHPKLDLAVEFPGYNVVPYYQVFAQKNGFIPHLSVIDLLFNMGPESLLVLDKMVR